MKFIALSKNENNIIGVTISVINVINANPNANEYITNLPPPIIINNAPTIINITHFVIRCSVWRIAKLTNKLNGTNINNGANTININTPNTAPNIKAALTNLPPPKVINNAPTIITNVQDTTNLLKCSIDLPANTLSILYNIIGANTININTPNTAPNCVHACTNFPFA